MYGLGEMMGPPVDPNQPVSGPDVQQQIADVWSYLWEGPGAGGTVVQQIAPPPPSQLISGIPNTTLAIGAGVVLLGMAFMKGRR
jgi:hypothetical protein